MSAKGCKGVVVVSRSSSLPVRDRVPVPASVFRCFPRYFSSVYIFMLFFITSIIES